MLPTNLAKMVLFGSSSSSAGVRPPTTAPTPPKPVDSFIRPDERLASFTSLLRAPASSAVHLSLLDDNSLYGAIAYYLSGLEDAHVAPFAQAIAGSASLWATPLPTSTSTSASTSSNSSKAGSAPPITLLARATNVSRAVAQATTRRVDLVLKSRLGSIGWGTRKRIGDWVQLLLGAANSHDLTLSLAQQQQVPPELVPLHAQPIARLAILTGLLLGLKAVKEQQKQNAASAAKGGSAAARLSVGAPLRKVEDEWIVAASECFELASSLYRQTAAPGIGEASQDAGSSSGGSAEEDAWEREFRRKEAEAIGQAPEQMGYAERRKRWEVALVLTASVAAYLPERKLEILPTEATVFVVSDAILGLFEHHDVLAHVAEDTQRGSEDDKLGLRAGGQTIQRTAALAADVLYPWLGPLSRVLAIGLSSAIKSSTPIALEGLLHSRAPSAAAVGQGSPAAHHLLPLFERIRGLSAHLERGWLASDLAGAPDSAIAASSQEHTKQLWTVFKSLIFSLTMVFDTMIEALIDMCPSPTEVVRADASRASGLSGSWPPVTSSNLPSQYIAIVQEVLRTYGHLYWIVGNFGTAGFTAYTRVFYSSLDILGRDSEACVVLMEQIEPRAQLEAQELEMNEAKRSAVTYYLDVAEQLTAALPDEMLEKRVLPACKP